MNLGPDPTIKIAIVIGQLAQGGSERQLYAFLKHCDREHWSPILYISRGPIEWWDDSIRELGIPIILLHGSPLQRMWQFRRSCQANHVRRFFSWASHTNTYSLALWGLGIPGIGSFRNTYSAELTETDRPRWLRAWAYLAGVNTIVCNSQEAAADVDCHAGKGKRVVYVPNSIQPIGTTELYRTSWRQKLGIQNGEILIVGVGRLAPQKNFARFIEAIAHVNQTIPIRAVIAGKDYMGCLASLQQQMELLRLDPSVLRFIGSVPDARELLCAADIFVLSSDYEGMPNVVMEAMAAGVPCVSTKVNGVSDLITTGVNGFVTEHRADALAEKIKLLAQDKALRQEMGARAAKRMDTSFDPQTMAARLWQLCE